MSISTRHSWGKKGDRGEQGSERREKKGGEWEGGSGGPCRESNTSKLEKSDQETPAFCRFTTCLTKDLDFQESLVRVQHSLRMDAFKPLNSR